MTSNPRALPRILFDDLLQIRSTALSRHLNQPRNVKGHLAEFQAHARPSCLCRAENRVLGPGVEVEIVVRLIVAVGDANAARIEVEAVTDAADLLHMGVPAGEPARVLPRKIDRKS